MASLISHLVTSSVKLWSALPTPLHPDLRLDEPSLERTIEATVADGVTGIFLAGTCGEGPWLPNNERVGLVKSAVRFARGRLRIAVQVTDNSARRVLDNVAQAADAGADLAIVASPTNLLNSTPDRVAGLFEEVAGASPLAVGIYDLGARRPFAIPTDHLKRIYLLPNVRLVKDSSGDPERRAVALAARRERPSLELFNGDEFLCLDYLEAGYEGCLFGGMVVVAPLVRRIVRLHQAGDREGALAADRDMKRILYGIYGGESISCWLTGLKYYLQRRGLFASAASYLEYPLTDECKAFIDRYVQQPREP